MAGQEPGLGPAVSTRPLRVLHAAVVEQQRRRHELEVAVLLGAHAAQLHARVPRRPRGLRVLQQQCGGAGQGQVGDVGVIRGQQGPTAATTPMPVAWSSA